MPDPMHAARLWEMCTESDSILLKPLRNSQTLSSMQYAWLVMSDLVCCEACLEKPGLRLEAVGLHRLCTQLLNTREGILELLKPVLTARVVCHPLQLLVQGSPADSTYSVKRGICEQELGNAVHVSMCDLFLG